MNLMKKLTLKNLKLNRKRTIVTIVGIILATALLSALVTLVSSFQSERDMIQTPKVSYRKTAHMSMRQRHLLIL